MKNIRGFISNYPSAMYWVAPLLFFITLVGINFFIYNDWDSFSGFLEFLIREFPPLAFLAIGIGLVLATGEVDISIVGVAIISGVICAFVNANLPFGIDPFGIWGLFIQLITVLMFGSIFGLFLAYIVTKYRTPTLVLTWALGIILVNIAAIIANPNLLVFVFGEENSIRGTSKIEFLTNTPADLYELVWSPGVQLSLILFGLAIITIKFFWLDSRAGAIGANADSAVYAGINPKKTLIAVFIFCSACASIAGMLLALKEGNAPVSWEGRELVAIAIAVLGGTSLAGGYYNPFSILCAAGFWISLEHVVQVSDFRIFEEYQQFLPFMIFALIIIFVLILSGNRLGGLGLRHIHVLPKARY